MCEYFSLIPMDIMRLLTWNSTTDCDVRDPCFGTKSAARSRETTGGNRVSRHISGAPIIFASNYVLLSPA